QVDVINAGDTGDIDAAFLTLVQRRAGALLILPDALFVSRRIQMVTLAARHAIPAIYTSRDYADVGGLMSYGANLAEVYRQLGVYTGRVLKGEAPADLPIVRPTK